MPHAFGYVVTPLLVSRRGKHHGWRGDCPGALNLFGLPLILSGAAFIGWAIRSHYRASPEGVQFRAKPGYLVTDGAYARSRNPLYVGGLTMWAGWAVLLGSVPVAVVGSALLALLAKIGIPFEERMLSRHFGEMYREYRRTVPRWLRPRV